MFIRKRHMVTLALMVMSCLLLQLSPVLASTRSQRTLNLETSTALSDASQISAAKAALAAQSTFTPVQGIDSNIISMAQSIVDQVSSGIKVTIYRSNNRQISRTGTITYGNTVSTGRVTFRLSKNQRSSTQAVNVVVAPNVNLDSDTVAITAAKNALANIGILNPVEDKDGNVTVMAQKVVDTAVSGVAVDIVSSSNSQVDDTGNIIYGSQTGTGSVMLELSINDAIGTQKIEVIVPAKVIIDTDKLDVDNATSALTKASVFTPLEGVDNNLQQALQKVVDSATDGVVVDVLSSNNPNVGQDGSIIYGTSKVSGSVNLNLTKNNASAQLDILINVPAHSQVDGLNVRDYGAKGDGIANDTTAFNNAILAAYNAGGGSIYVPDGTYMIDIGTSIKMKNNCTLTISDGGILKANSDSENAVIKINNGNNIRVTGGQIIGGTGIKITGSDNISVTDTTITDSYWDGIYIGSNTTRYYNQGITIERVNISDVRRNGISVISARDLTIRDCVIDNSDGALPCDGIDLEPNETFEVLENILIENVVSSNNGSSMCTKFGGWGYSMWLGTGISGSEFALDKAAVSITLRNCSGSGNYRTTVSSEFQACINAGYNIAIE